VWPCHARDLPTRCPLLQQRLDSAVPCWVHDRFRIRVLTDRAIALATIRGLTGSRPVTVTSISRPVNRMAAASPIPDVPPITTARMFCLSRSFNTLRLTLRNRREDANSTYISEAMLADFLAHSRSHSAKERSSGVRANTRPRRIRRTSEPSPDAASLRPSPDRHPLPGQHR
jgi:hypothetical protein